ncbi:MAG: chromosomal replication initiator protein DnaA [Planctomycetes bacterium]|nr:chromosomal replication initiator protein DnaA [Planctomycetota bacterium]
MTAQEALSSLPSPEDPSKDALWDGLQRAIRSRMKPEQFETWFRRAALASFDADVVRIAVQNTFSRDWLRTYYGDLLADSAREVFHDARRVEVLVDPELLLRRAPPPQAPAEEPERASAVHSGESLMPRTDVAPGSERNLAREARALGNPNGALGNSRGADGGRGLLASSDVGLNPKYTFDNFVVGPCNRFAHAAALGSAEAPGKAYNPFFLHGSVGLGKTHLLQSLCWAILDRTPRARILFLSCETFVNHFINSLENGDIAKFRHKYRNVDVLVVDDIHLLANKDRTQEEFFHTFNTLYHASKQIVLSCDSPPKEIPTLQDRLVSRFKWGLVTEIEPPCFETRTAILKRKSRERGRELSDDLAGLLAERIDSNIRELEGAVTKLLGYAALSGQPLSVDVAREALRELFHTKRGQPSMEDILTIITEHFGVKLSDLQSKKRTHAIAFPRQMAMFLARQITRHSLEEIGGFFGGRDHSTVIYAVDKIQQLSEQDPASRALLDGFLARLQGPRS